ncbi:MAG: hypothetical protein J6Z49_05925 [Kiritimatiellae bacterium]|nr:hypothetical protein [Kiritimatiellia bacterium]
MNAGLLKTIRAIVAKDPRFAINAYLFVQESLDVAVKGRLHRCGAIQEAPRHVDAKDWLQAFKEYALSEFGPLARDVLEEWGIRSTADVGELVAHLVDAGVIARQKGDTYDQFKDVFSFEEAFERPYRVDSP